MTDYRDLTSSERAVYQSLMARGISAEDALHDALDGVSVEDARSVGPGRAEPPTPQEGSLREDLIKVFQKSWHDADAGGNKPSGTRTGAGIDAVLDHLREKRLLR